jgi:tetratricopeptide (TPR) repeat protein
MYSPYTQLFLTHVDDAGRSTPPVVLANFTQPERAANIPEFVNVAPDAIGAIAAAFLDDESYYRAGEQFAEQDDPLGAVPLYRKAIEINPKHVLSHFRLGTILMNLGRHDEAKTHLLRVVEYEPGFYGAHMNLGLTFVDLGEIDEGEKHLAEAVRLEPDDPFANYYYGHALHRRGKLDEAARRYERALKNEPNSVPALLGLASLSIAPEPPGRYDPHKAVALAEKACRLMAGQNEPHSQSILAAAYAAAGRFDDALRTSDEAMRMARAAGDLALARQIEEVRKAYEQAAARRTTGTP